MSRKLYIVLIVKLLTNDVFCFDIFEEFKNKLQQQYVDPFTKDVAALTSTGILNYSKPLELFTVTSPSIGLVIRPYLAAKKINENNQIIKDAMKEQKFDYIFLPIFQIEKGLPLNLDVVFRGMFLNDSYLFGFGLKYCILKSPFLPVPDIGISGIYNKIVAKDILDFNSTLINFSLSFNIPVFQPYLVFGYDNFELSVNKKLLSTKGIPGEIKSSFSNQTRFEAGANLSIFPFVYLNGSYAWIYEDESFSVGLGLKF